MLNQLRRRRLRARSPCLLIWREGSLIFSPRSFRLWSSAYPHLFGRGLVHPFGDCEGEGSFVAYGLYLRFFDLFGLGEGVPHERASRHADYVRGVVFFRAADKRGRAGKVHWLEERVAGLDEVFEFQVFGFVFAYYEFYSVMAEVTPYFERLQVFHCKVFFVSEKVAHLFREGLVRQKASARGAGVIRHVERFREFHLGLSRPSLHVEEEVSPYEACLFRDSRVAGLGAKRPQYKP